MEKKTDILILGAGPAGCMAAFLLSEKFNVTIVELKKLPRKKSCSGVLIKKSVEIIEKHFGEIPENTKCTPFNTTGLNIINEDNELFEFPDQGVNIIREKFDNWLVECVKVKGVEVLTETRTLEIRKNESEFCTKISSKNKDTIKLYSKHIVACDGINGTSRKLCGAIEQQKVITVQEFYKGSSLIDFSKFYAFTSPEFSQYDAWINSKNGKIVIGSIAFNRKNAENYLSIFIDYLKKEHGFELHEPTKKEIWALPLVFPDFEILYEYNGVFFVGEVAGFLNPFGEGISIALTSGKAIAEAIMCTTENTKIEYERKMKPEVEYMKRQWDYLKSITPIFFENARKRNEIRPSR